MNIQISGLPENQKIKSINFNIVFDDSNIDTTTISIEPQRKSNIDNTNTIFCGTTETANTIDKESDIPKPEEIDISKRVAKIDPDMLGESF
jgi:hypothetical protein